MKSQKNPENPDLLVFGWSRTRTPDGVDDCSSSARALCL
jgi:hypothetical protein